MIWARRILSIIAFRVDETTPIRQRAKRLPLWQRAEADEQVREMVQKGIIEPSSSPWASPVVLVKKKRRLPHGFAWIIDPSTLTS